MPMQRHLYPPDWEQIALAIKQEADWVCQECHRQCRKHGESKADFTDRLGLTGVSDLKLGRYTLTVAHLNHQPSDCRLSNLKALCAVCHCRYDLRQMALKKQLRRERNGQLRLNFDLTD